MKMQIKFFRICFLTSLLSNRAALTVLLGLAAFLLTPSVHAQSGGLLLSEIVFDPPSNVSEACQYVELRGTPGATVPAGIYFLSVDGASGSFGLVTNSVNLSGLTVGSNGTITIILDPVAIDSCPGRTYGSGTTLVLINDAFQVVGGNTADPSEAESFLLVSTPGTLNDGDDIDVNNDKVIDPARQITVIDGFAITVNSVLQAAYAPVIYDAITATGGISAELPDAATRFAGNNAPLSAASWFFGELASSPDNTTTYAGEPQSPNFPTGGALTPGAQNVASLGPDAPVDFTGDGHTDYVVVRPAGGAGSQLTWYNAINGGSPQATRNWGINGDQVLMGDYDADNKDDVTVFRPSNATFYIIQSASFTIRIDHFGQTGDNARVVGDYDGDGRDDLAVYRAGTQSFWYYKTSPTALFNAVAWGQATDTPAPGDYDGDGQSDFVVRRANGAGGVFWKRHASGEFSNEAFGQANDLVVPGDYDDDGRTDLAVVRLAGGVFVWDFEPSGTAGTTVISDTWGEPGDLTVQGDYNGDGRTDYAVWRPGNPATFYVMTVAVRNIFSKQWGQAGDYPVANFNTFQ